MGSKFAQSSVEDPAGLTAILWEDWGRPIAGETLYAGTENANHQRNHCVGPKQR